MTVGDDRLERIRRMAEADPGDPRPLYFLAQELFRVERWSEAAETYRAYHDLGPDDEGVGWRNLGTCLLRLADPNGAETMYRRAVEAARAHHHEDLASEIEEMIEEL
jgi:Flp pilus assembly protein TadD